ncbi:hypothetical protein FRB99_008433 [Tulasnella sp. 403]|nr:hypothetical protein FRB99_008433 [Tulasnella sp. 403]
MDSIPQGQRIKEKIKIEKKSCGGGGFAQLFKGRHPKHGDVALKRMLWSMDGRGEDIRETADALYYLFQMNIIHGDIKGSNILVSGTSHVLLCDFGLSRLASVATLADLRGHGTPGYMAPELWGDLPKSFGTDIFAFGMTISEILSGNVPYHGYQLPHAIFLAISNGTRPPMEPKTSPTGESYEPMWKIAECCWKKEPEARPTISEVFKDLFTISSMRVPPKVPNIMTEAVGDIQSFDVVRADGRTKRMVLESGNLLSISRNLCTFFRGKGEDNQLYAIKCYPLPCQGSSFEEQLVRGSISSNLKDVLIRLTPQERFTQQTVDWQYLDHPFLLPFIGTARVEARFLYLISPWEEKRSLLEYLDRHADADRTRLIHEATQALAYLHKGGITHGRVKAGNILVGKRSQVLLCDYDLGGLVLVQGALGLEEYKDLRRDSPELWDGQSRSTKSDVYAFGMMIYEILSGRIPFYQYCDMITLTRVVKDKGELPPADPAHSLSGRSYSPLWDIARQCWIRNPNERPAMSDLLTQLDRKDLSITAGSAPNNGPQTVPFRKPMEYKAWLPTWSMRDIIPISFFSTIAAAGKVKYVTTYIGNRHKRIKVYPGPVATGNFCEVFQGSEASLGTVALKRWHITTTSVTFEQQEASIHILLLYPPILLLTINLHHR